MSEEYQPPSVYSVLPIQAALGALLMIALLNGRRDLALVTLLLLVIMTGARIWSRISLRGLHVRIDTDRRRLFPGETLAVTARVENRKWLPVRLRLEMFFADGFQTTQDDAVCECGLLWHQAAEFRWQLRAVQRGVYRLGHARITAGDFCGFYLRARTTGHAPIEVLVYPNIGPLSPPAYPRENLFGAPGARSPVQDPIYILGTRDYHQRQPARHIHWKASARHDRLQVKVFEASAQDKILLLVDTASFAPCNARADFERTLETAASLAVECDRRGHAVGFLTNGRVDGGADRASASRGPQSICAILNILARLNMQAARPLSEHLRSGAHMTGGVSAVCFAYAAGEDAPIVESVFMNRRTPLLFVLCHRGTAAGAVTVGEIAAKAAAS